MVVIVGIVAIDIIVVIVHILVPVSMILSVDVAAVLTITMKCVCRGRAVKPLTCQTTVCSTWGPVCHYYFGNRCKIVSLENIVVVARDIVPGG